jgi:hypothetical protein
MPPTGWLPAWHKVQLLLPSGATYPLGQAAQLACPCSGLKVDCPQGRQLAAEAALKVPGPHTLQFKLPAVEKLPALQGTQLVAAARSPYMPAGQGRHTPLLSKVLGGQALQLPLLGLEPPST